MSSLTIRSSGPPLVSPSLYFTHTIKLPLRSFFASSESMMTGTGIIPSGQVYWAAATGLAGVIRVLKLLWGLAALVLGELRSCPR